MGKAILTPQAARDFLTGNADDLDRIAAPRAVSANASTMVSVLAPLRGLPLNTTIFIEISLLHAAGARHIFCFNQKRMELFNRLVSATPHLVIGATGQKPVNIKNKFSIYRFYVRQWSPFDARTVCALGSKKNLAAAQIRSPPSCINDAMLRCLTPSLSCNRGSSVNK